MAQKTSSYINILTYIVFTIVPIVMFASIMILRLMETHESQVEQLEMKIDALQEKLGVCQNESYLERNRVSVLLDSQKKCRITLEKVSTTLEDLTQAFQVQWKRSNVAEAKLEQTLGHFTDLHKSLVLKDNITIKLQDTNDQLRQKVDKLSQNLNNVTIDKEILKNQLEDIKGINGSDDSASPLTEMNQED